MVVTNALGVAFTAALLSASDAGVTFVFPEDGATNTLAWASLSGSSRASVSAATGFEPVPPQLAAAFAQAERDSRRIAALVADERLDAETAAERRRRLRRTFMKFCRKQGINDVRAARLADRCIR